MLLSAKCIYTMSSAVSSHGFLSILIIPTFPILWFERLIVVLYSSSICWFFLCVCVCVLLCSAVSIKLQQIDLFHCSLCTFVQNNSKVIQRKYFVVSLKRKNHCCLSQCVRLIPSKLVGETL